MFFVLPILKNFFINLTKHVFFLEQKLFSKIQFLNTIFFSKNTKNCFQKLFFKTDFQNSNQTDPKSTGPNDHARPKITFSWSPKYGSENQ